MWPEQAFALRRSWRPQGTRRGGFDLRAGNVGGAGFRLPVRLPGPAAHGDHPRAPAAQVRPGPDFDVARRLRATLSAPQLQDHDSCRRRASPPSDTVCRGMPVGVALGLASVNTASRVTSTTLAHDRRQIKETRPSPRFPVTGTFGTYPRPRSSSTIGSTRGIDRGEPIMS